MAKFAVEALARGCVAPIVHVARLINRYDCPLSQPAPAEQSAAVGGPDFDDHCGVELPGECKQLLILRSHLEGAQPFVEAITLVVIRYGFDGFHSTLRISTQQLTDLSAGKPPEDRPEAALGQPLEIESYGFCCSALHPLLDRASPGP